MSENADLLKKKSLILKLYLENPNYLLCLDVLSEELNINELELVQSINSMISDSELDKKEILRNFLKCVHNFKNAEGLKNFPNITETVRIARSYFSSIYGEQSKIVKFSHKSNIVTLLKENKEWDKHTTDRGGRPTEKSRTFSDFSNYKFKKFLKVSCFDHSEAKPNNEESIPQKLRDIAEVLEFQKKEGRNQLIEFSKHLFSDLQFIQVEDSFIEEKVDTWIKTQ